MLNVGVVGATGMVGEAFLTLLNERHFPIQNLKLFASQNSEGQMVDFRGQMIEVQTLKPGCFNGLNLVFISTDEDVSREWSPQAVKAGAFVIDNSSAFRLNPENLLVVPEVNGQRLPKKTSAPALIANPNCSTIQLVMALHPLRSFGLKHVRVATYQAVSGAGKLGEQELRGQINASVGGQMPHPPQTFAHPIAFNVIPHIGSFGADGFCSEETKVRLETKKILELPQLPVSAFTVRVPVMNGHSEAVWVTFDSILARDQIEKALEHQDGLVYVPHSPAKNYPTALGASGNDAVYVGRLHQDVDDPYTWLMWIVSDNLRKGAALNGLQIAERIFEV